MYVCVYVCMYCTYMQTGPTSLLFMYVGTAVLFPCTKCIYVHNETFSYSKLVEIVVGNVFAYP